MGPPGGAEIKLLPWSLKGGSEITEHHQEISMEVKIPGNMDKRHRDRRGAARALLGSWVVKTVPLTARMTSAESGIGGEVDGEDGGWRRP